MNDEEIIDAVFASQADRSKIEATAATVTSVDYAFEQAKLESSRVERQLQLAEQQVFIAERQTVLFEQQNRSWERIATALEKLVSK